jgi:hypothetical protein
MIATDIQNAYNRTKVGSDPPRAAFLGGKKGLRHQIGLHA